jgi:hypothetical protein
MNRKSIRSRLVLAAVGLLAAFAVLAANSDPAGKWRVEFDHWAENDGELVLRVAPLNGVPVDVTAKITKNMTENSVADLVKSALKAQLGKGYKIEVDDGEDVLIKKSGKTPKFVVTLVNSSVTGLEIKIRHD